MTTYSDTPVRATLHIDTYHYGNGAKVGFGVGKGTRSARHTRLMWQTKSQFHPLKSDQTVFLVSLAKLIENSIRYTFSFTLWSIKHYLCSALPFLFFHFKNAVEHLYNLSRFGYSIRAWIEIWLCSF